MWKWPVGQAAKTTASHAVNGSSILPRVTNFFLDIIPIRCYNNKGFLRGKQKIVGVNCDEGTPVPIPNTVVKLVYGDNTWLVTAREDNSSRTQTPTQSSRCFVFVKNFLCAGSCPFAYDIIS